MKYLLLSLSLLLSNLSPAQGFRQTQTDSYTRYELLSPRTREFRIIYDVTATTAGATKYFNTLRKGSEHDIEFVLDQMAGKPLTYKVVDGATAKANGHLNARNDQDYLMVNLNRPVPEGGQTRLRIYKVYKDPTSYKENEDGSIIFERSLGIKRNSVVLPKGYELIGCNYPSQVIREDNGDIKVSFFNNGEDAVNYRILARPASNLQFAPRPVEDPWPDYQPRPSGRDKSKARASYEVNERAYQNRDITYFLNEPETNSFFLYHDYTETRVGQDKYVNIVRAGSKASNPSAILLDTGEELKVETLVGQEIADKGIEVNNLTDDTEAVVIWYDAIKENESKRLRISETYTDPNRYLLVDGRLIWDRSFGRNRNTVVLPQGWLLTASSIPGKIDLTEDGRVRIRYINDRPDNIDVFIKAIRRR